jgi:hypothetical protein
LLGDLFVLFDTSLPPGCKEFFAREFFRIEADFNYWLWPFLEFDFDLCAEPWCSVWATVPMASPDDLSETRSAILDYYLSFFFRMLLWFTLGTSVAVLLWTDYCILLS